MWIRSLQWYSYKNLDPRNQNAQKVSIINEKPCQNFKIKNLPKKRQIGEHVNEKVIKMKHNIMIVFFLSFVFYWFFLFSFIFIFIYFIFSFLLFFSKNNKKWSSYGYTALKFKSAKYSHLELILGETNLHIKSLFWM